VRVLGHPTRTRSQHLSSAQHLKMNAPRKRRHGSCQRQSCINSKRIAYLDRLLPAPRIAGTMLAA
jgi:hypothetical protein